MTPTAASTRYIWSAVPSGATAWASKSKHTTDVITPPAKLRSRLTVRLESFRNRQDTTPPRPVPPRPASAVMNTISQSKSMDIPLVIKNRALELTKANFQLPIIVTHSGKVNPRKPIAGTIFYFFDNSRQVRISSAQGMSGTPAWEFFLCLFSLIDERGFPAIMVIGKWLPMMIDGANHPKGDLA